jgi:hypothetical protein
MSMDTTTQINRLLRNLEVTAGAMIDPQHPSVDVHLALNGLTPGADGIMECVVAERHVTAAGMDITLAPVTSHCFACGSVFELEPGAREIYCSKCRPQHPAPDPGTPTP